MSEISLLKRDGGSGAASRPAVTKGNLVNTTEGKRRHADNDDRGEDRIYGGQIEA